MDWSKDEKGIKRGQKMENVNERVTVQLTVEDGELGGIGVRLQARNAKTL